MSEQQTFVFRGQSAGGGSERVASGESNRRAPKTSGRRPAAPAPSTRAARRGPARATAQDLAKQQREISVSEFFAKNRHLLGFDNPSKALLTTVKEAVDNALDACEEAGLLPRAARRDRAACRNPIPRRCRGQRPGHRAGPSSQGLRSTALRIEVSPASAEPRPAGHWDQRGGHVRPAHHGQARGDHHEDRSQEARPSPRARDRYAEE